MTCGNILVVDDTLASLRLLTDLLSAERYPVLPTDSGELALAIVARHRPELILLDLRMPGMVTDTERRIKVLRLGACRT